MGHYVPGMSLIAWKLANGGRRASNGAPPPPRLTGLDIFGTGPYPHSLNDYVGQYTATLQLSAAMLSARKMVRPLDHVLLASGTPGIGKTALAKLVAFHLGVGIVELGGAVGEKEVAAALSVMQDYDVLFLDEVHRLVNRGKAKAEWLLTLLQDGRLVLPTGVVTAPRITVIAATTDAQKLPETILDRFLLKPVLRPYTDEEAQEIALMQARRLGFGSLPDLPLPEAEGWLGKVATACNNNPRRMTMLLTSIRDHAFTSAGGQTDVDGYIIDTALDWQGLTDDGLDTLCQHYLIGLLAYNGCAGESTMKALLNEEQLRMTEKLLIQKGFIQVTPRGRELTDMGADRASALARAEMPNPLSSSLEVRT